MNAQGRFRRNHGRTDIHGRSFTVRNPVFFQKHQFFHGFHKKIFIDSGHTQSFGGCIHPLNIFHRTEKINGTVLSPIGLQSLKYFLTVMQAHGRGIKL